MPEPVANDALAAAVLLGWTPVVMLLFWRFGGRVGSLAAVMGGYLILPRTWVRPPGVLHFLYFEKQAAIGLALCLAMIVCDRRRLLRFRPNLWDLPILIFTAWMAMIAVGGQYVDYFVADLICQRRVWWLASYLAGRIYFDDSDGARQIAVWVVAASLFLVPLVVLEATLGPAASPMAWIYGTPSGMAPRLGGWRPEVFFDHGIELSCWLALASVTAVWLWLGGSWPSRRGPAWLPALVLVPATLLTRGVYGYLDLAAGLVATVVTMTLRTRLAMLALGMVVVLYVGTRASGFWDGQSMVRALQGAAREESSVRSRVSSENAMITNVMNHNPAFGFGRPLGFAWPGAGAVSAPGTDGLWIVFLWSTGLVGLTLHVVAQYAIPAGLALSRPSGRPRRDQVGAPEWGLALFVLLAMVDGLHNMPSFGPLPLIAGALVGGALNPNARIDRRRKPPEEKSVDQPKEGPWDQAVRRGGFVLKPAEVAAGLACVLYVFGHAPVAGFDGLKLVGGLGAPLLFAAAGAAGSWASRRFTAGAVVWFALLFATLGVSFNLALHPSTRPGTSADILQGMALCGLIVALWRRAFGGAVWADSILAAAPLAVHLLLRPYLPAFPGSQYFYAGRGAADAAESLFPVLPWLSLAALGGRALRDSSAVNLASGVLLGLGTAAFLVVDTGGAAPVFEKFPMNLPYALLGGSAISFAFALGRFPGFRGPPAEALCWLGQRWLVYFYAHLGVAQILGRLGVRQPWAAWLLLAAGGLGATWLVCAAAAPFARRFRASAPWLLLLVTIFATWLLPGIPPVGVIALAGVAGLVFGANYTELAALAAETSSPKPAAGRRPEIQETTVGGPWRVVARGVLLLALLAAPEAFGALETWWHKHKPDPGSIPAADPGSSPGGADTSAPPTTLSRPIGTPGELR